MARWDPQVLITAAKKSGVKYDVDETWLKIDPYPGSFNPQGVVWHHTACSSIAKGNMPSLQYCRFPGPYAGKARACHIVVGRDGSMQIIAGKGAYHAGAGGPMKINGVTIPKDAGNHYLIGFEIEASSTKKINKKNVITPKWNMNPAQFDAMVAYCAALFDIMGWDETSAIRHRDWAPGRKIDVEIPLDVIREAIKVKMAANKAATKPVKPAPTTPPVSTPPASKPTAPTPATKPTVRLKNVQPKQTHANVALVQKALASEFPKAANSDKEGYFGAGTKALYLKWQKSLGYSGSDADGIPGITSLRALGKKHGFTVRNA